MSPKIQRVTDQVVNGHHLLLPTHFLFQQDSEQEFCSVTMKANVDCAKIELEPVSPGMMLRQNMPNWALKPKKVFASATTVNSAFIICASSAALHQCEHFGSFCQFLAKCGSQAKLPKDIKGNLPAASPDQTDKNPSSCRLQLNFNGLIMSRFVARNHPQC